MFLQDTPFNLPAQDHGLSFGQGTLGQQPLHLLEGVHLLGNRLAGYFGLVDLWKPFHLGLQIIWDSQCET